MGRPPDIRFIPLPSVLRGKYQYFTQADMTKLQGAGYRRPFLSLEAGVEDYVRTHLGPRV
jgi:ADP-L-glycero-D-manno-heptose 6-epimerase